MNLEAYIKEFRQLFNTTKPREGRAYINESEYVPMTYIKTKASVSSIKEAISRKGFEVVENSNVWWKPHEPVAILVQEGVIQFFEQNNDLREETITEQKAEYVSQIAPYFKKIAQELNSKSVATKKNNPKLSEKYKYYYHLFNHLSAQAQLNRTDYVKDELQKNLDEDAVSFIYTELHDEDVKTLSKELQELGLPIQ